MEGENEDTHELVVALGIAGSCPGTVYAAESTKQVTPQQQRMADCNKMAGEKGLKGDARKQFMSNCLSGKTDGSPPLRLNRRR